MNWEGTRASDQRAIFLRGIRFPFWDELALVPITGIAEMDC
jgi:hypothetical protein